jgi:hypothetical protein
MTLKAMKGNEMPLKSKAIKDNTGHQRPSMAIKHHERPSKAIEGHKV